MTANDFDFKCAEEMLGVLFALEDALGLMPTEGGGLGAESKNRFAPKISMALKTWSDMRSKLEKAEVTQEEYDLWHVEFKD